MCEIHLRVLTKWMQCAWKDVAFKIPMVQVIRLDVNMRVSCMLQGQQLFSQYSSTHVWNSRVKCISSIEVKMGKSTCMGVSMSVLNQ